MLPQAGWGQAMIGRTRGFLAALYVAGTSVWLVGVIPPALAADPKLDPDPKALPKARTIATAKADANFDLGSDKVPFPTRFGICVLQLTAVRDEGRALPASRADLDKAIADYRALAIELKAHAAKISAADAQKAVDAELAKSAADTLKFVREDVDALGVSIRKARNLDRLQACQLTKDWYAAQNGLRAPVDAAEQAKVAVLAEQARQAEKATSAKPPAAAYPPVIYPSTVAPRAVAPAAPAVAASKPVSIPAAGVPDGGEDSRDVRVGAGTADTKARADFDGRPLWSAVAECVDRMELIQALGGGSTKVQVDGYANQASDIYKLDRGIDKAAATAQVGRERERLRARVAASWDSHQARTGQPPWGEWSQSCDGLQKHALSYVNNKNAADYARYLADFQRKRQEAERAAAANNANSSSSSSSGYSGGSGYSSSSSDNGAASRREHEATMQRYERENRQIRQEIKAIDRKYGR